MTQLIEEIVPTAPVQLDDETAEAWNETLSAQTARERVAWAAEQFGDHLVMSTSFGIQSALMLHLVTEVVPGIPIIFVDTGYLFDETYQFAEQLTERLRLNLKVYSAHRSAAWQESLYGKRWERSREELERYNLENKVEPMNRALRELGATAWLTGLRRAQASTRSELNVVKLQKRTVKIHPVVEWTERDVYTYLTENDLPYHPLWEQGYASVGDWHSSRPLGAGMTAEETRFNGMKRECGLHELSGQVDFQI